MTVWGWVILGVANIPVYYGLGRVMFKTLEDFEEGIYYWFKPDLWSLFQGEYWKDQYGQFRFGLWLTICIACVIGEGWVIEKIIGVT